MFSAAGPTISLSSLGDAVPFSLATSRQSTWKECSDRSSSRNTGSKKWPFERADGSGHEHRAVHRHLGHARAIRGVVDSTEQGRSIPFTSYFI